jgi:hypothetical protein
MCFYNVADMVNQLIFKVFLEVTRGKLISLCSWKYEWAMFFYHVADMVN